MKISVVINTYNAEEFLERVLDTVKDFDEIIICDMNSTDKTLNIVSKYNCKLFFHERTGIVEPARAYAIAQASNDWVLVVDADELVTKDLRDYLYNIVNSNTNITALRIPRKNYLFGRFMHSAYPDYVLRFFRKGCVTWPTIIHSHPIVDGKIDTIPAKYENLAFIHLANEPIRMTIQKMNTYTDFERERRKERHYGYCSLIFEPFLRFLRFYLFKGGFRDGVPGLIWACMYAYYKFITIAKVIEAQTSNRCIDDDLNTNL